MAQPLTHLGDMPIETFIRDYWQKKPLLIRQAFKDFKSPITSDELAGLALEEEIESRLIIEEGKKPWELRSGPFEEGEFSQLPNDKWTLLVQAVDHYVPEVADILDNFRFIPNWRLDDLMISYAVDGGSVGPHFDRYDVFLLQAEGKRHWKIGQTCDAHTKTKDGIDLQQVAEFDSQEDWVLEPGDMLYLPPMLAHWGTASGDDCMTFSIGFRAPSQADLLNDFTQEQMSLLSEDQRLTDANFAPQSNPGEISDQAIEQVIKLITEGAQDKQQLKSWFGKLMTQPKYGDEQQEAAEASDVEETKEQLESAIKQAPLELERNPASRFAFSLRTPSIVNIDTAAQLFVDGRDFETNKGFAELICGSRFITLEQASAAQLHILAELFEAGNLGWLEEE